MTDPTPLDLDAIRARADARRDYADERPESLHVPEDYAALADESAADVPALVEEVKRLRAESQQFYENRNLWQKRAEKAEAEVARLEEDLSDRTMDLAEMTRPYRPAPAWDEEAAAERAFTAAANAAANDETWAKASDHTKDWWRMVAQAALRDHLPVKPDRETVRLAQHQALMPQAMSIFAAVGGTQADYDALLDTLADAVLDLLPGRSEATVKAEALRSVRAWVADLAGESINRRALKNYLDDRLATEGGVDRG